MIKITAFFVMVSLFFSTLTAQEIQKNNEVVYKVVPLLSSNPTSGTGVGAAAMAVYKVDADSSPSQAIVGGQYTNTDSYSVFGANLMFFDQDRWQSKTFGGYILNNSAYNIPSYVPLPPIITDPVIKINVTVAIAGEQLLYRVKPNWYVGGQIFYISQKFKAQNSTGAAFLNLKGVADSQRFAYGGALSYDTRSKSEKFFPKDALWIDFVLNQFPKTDRDTYSYHNAVLNCRAYTPGLQQDDVIAMQLYGHYSSKYTPDGALAPLGARNIIRGFPIGLHKARNMVAMQAEYRYRIPRTKFRATAFGGWANLSGGSYGNGLGNNRESDNGDYYSGGVGVHYILDVKQQLDYRINVVYSSDDEVSVYAGLNQAF